jgi:hypothetical protein
LHAWEIFDEIAQKYSSMVECFISFLLLLLLRAEMGLSKLSTGGERKKVNQRCQRCHILCTLMTFRAHTQFSFVTNALRLGFKLRHRKSVLQRFPLRKFVIFFSVRAMMKNYAKV